MRSSARPAISGQTGNATGNKRGPSRAELERRIREALSQRQQRGQRLDLRILPIAALADALEAHLIRKTYRTTRSSDVKMGAADFERASARFLKAISQGMAFPFLVSALGAEMPGFDWTRWLDDTNRVHRAARRVSRREEARGAPRDWRSQWLAEDVARAFHAAGLPIRRSREGLYVVTLGAIFEAAGDSQPSEKTLFRLAQQVTTRATNSP